MTTPLLSPGGKRKAAKEERNRRTLARAAKKVEDERKAREEQGKQDAERARKEQQGKERKKQEEREKQRKDKEEKERESRVNLAKKLESVYTKMTTPEEQHRAARKKAEEDAAAAEITRLQDLEISNPCLFDKQLKYVITTLLHTNLYERDNPYRNLFESENIMSWVKFLEMYKTNPLSVYTDEFLTLTGMPTR